MQFRLSEPSVLGPPALLSRTSWVFENVSDATLFSVRRGPPGLPAVSRFLSNLYQLISLNACHLSATSRCSTVEYSTRRIRRCATRSSWSAWTSTRALCRCSFFLDLHFSSHCRHAGRREGCLGTPPLAPCPAISPLLPSLPSLLSFTPSLAPGVGVGRCGLGGREGGVILELTGISSTSRSLDARLTLALVLARRSLDFFTSTQRARLW